MSSNHCTCTSSCTTHETITKDGKTVEKTIHTDGTTDPNGHFVTKTTETDTVIDPNGNKTTTTHTSDAPAVNFDDEFERMKAKMDADMKDFVNDHPALK